MVMTILNAAVQPERVGDLERTYRQGTTDLPPEIVETFLVRGGGSYFRIVTVWSSRAALDAMRSSGVTPRGVQIFQSVGATPELAVLDVVVHREH